MTQHPEDHRKFWLEELVKKNEFTLGAEIGVHEGVTHFYLLDNCPSLTMIGVDVYLNNQAKYWPAVENKLDSYGIRSRFYKGFSVDAAKNVGIDELDFVFIDADHQYKSVISDIKTWYPKVKKGGYVTGHDVNHKGVKQALNEFFGDGNYHTAQDDIWYVKK